MGVVIIIICLVRDEIDVKCNNFFLRFMFEFERWFGVWFWDIGL